jgi:hypothetical protein
LHIGIWNNYEQFSGNRIFDPAAYTIGDDLGYPVINLRRLLNEKGIKIDTLDLYPPEEFDRIIFIDFPGSKRFDPEKLRKKKNNLYLFMTEVEIIYPPNVDGRNHRFFKKIFTFRDDLVDNRKFYKFFLPVKIPSGPQPANNKKDLFCTMIAGNKKNSDPRELYSERDRAVRWFEKNHPGEFDLYGTGWDKRTFKRPFGWLNRYEILRMTFYRTYTSYMGSILKKRDILSKYSFSICYENARDIQGYITEKIFDCFFAGCVPVYLGAPNITDFIPGDTFIDKRNFKSYEDLYSFMKGMPAVEYGKFISNIESFVQGDLICPFSAESFAELVMKNIVDDVSDEGK